MYRKEQNLGSVGLRCEGEGWEGLTSPDVDAEVPLIMKYLPNIMEVVVDDVAVADWAHVRVPLTVKYVLLFWEAAAKESLTTPGEQGPAIYENERISRELTFSECKG